MRRTFVPATATVLAAALVLSACSSADSSSDINYVSVNGTEPQTGLIPGDVNEGGGGRVMATLFSGLVYYDANGDVHNDMAESIELEGEKTYRVTLREGIKFSDGSPVTSASFVDAWNYAVANDQLNTTFFQPILGYEESVESLEGLKIVDDRTFTIELTQPESDFPQRLGYYGYAPLPESAFEDMDAFGENPVSNGPYKFVSWSHNEELVVEANPEYTGPREPKNDGVRYVFYAQPDAAYSDVLAGNLDVLDTIPSSAFATFEDELSGRTINKPSASYTELSIHMDTPGFQGEEGKLRRKALSLAINREEITETIFQGTRTPADDFTSSTLSGHSDSIPGNDVLKFNLEEAKKLWAEAEEIAPFEGPLEISYSVDRGHREWVDAVANQWSNALGVEAIGNPFPDFKAFRDTYRNDRMDGAYVTQWTADYPSIGNFLQPNYTSGVPSNDSAYENPEFDSLVIEANGASDATAAAQIYNRAQEKLLEDLPAIPLWYNNSVGVFSENVSGVDFDWKSFPVYYAIEK